MSFLSKCIKILEEKWGPFSISESYQYQGKPDYLEDGSFNYIFAPTDYSRYDEIAEKKGVIIPQELNKLYHECNGMRLFLSSFCIFGIQNGEADMEPYDLYIENHNIHSRMRENACDNEDLFFFGAYASDYVFAYSQKDLNRIILVENGNNEVIKEFKSLEELFESFIPKIITHYDSSFKKDIVDSDFVDYPALANGMYGLDEVGM